MTTLTTRLLLLTAVLIFTIYLTITTFKDHLNTSTIQDYTSGLFTDTSTDAESINLHTVTSDVQNKDGLAYMTFLSGTVANNSDTDINNDPYYIATRLLGYQLMHQPETRTRSNIPFLVLVTEDVPEEKRDRLTKDGATLIEVDYVDTPAWVVGEMPQWKDLMTKLRAWQLLKFKRGLFLDGDMILNSPLDGIFNDPNTHFTRSEPPSRSPGDQGVPTRYLLATMAEANPIHAYPPTAENGDYKDAGYFNAGFFVFGPSQEIFDYYMRLLHDENSFDPKYVEQNLLNHAHRQDGRMPWKRVDTKWNIRFPSEKDRTAGVASMHDKWWQAHMDEKLQLYYSGLRWRMEGFYEARDKLLKI